MAKIKLGGLAQDVRGSQNGLTFSRNKGGAYVRAKVSPCQPQTIRQIAQRGILAMVSQAWRNLTAVNRGNWAAWAEAHPILDVFGDSIKLSGISAFTSINANRLTLGMSVLEAVPAEPGDPPPAPTVVVADVGDNEIQITLASIPTEGANYLIWACPGQSAGVAAGIHKVVLANAYHCGAAEDAQHDFDPTDLNPRLTFALGQTVTVLVERLSNDGIHIDSTRFDVTAQA